jgi:hypothetical protein
VFNALLLNALRCGALPCAALHFNAVKTQKSFDKRRNPLTEYLSITMLCVALPFNALP